MAKTAVDITGVDVAISRHVSTKIHNCVFRKPTLVGRLMGLDNYYNRKTANKSVKLNLKGGKMRFTFWAGKPQWSEGDPLNPDYSQRKIDIVKRTKLKSGEVDAASLKFGEPIDKYEVNRIETEDELDDWGMQVAERAAEAFIERVDELMFPTTQSVGGAGFEGSRARVGQFSYPLQNGYADNNPLSTKNAFVYLGIDMHQFPELQAINVGTASTAFVPTETNIQEQLLMPLHDRGAQIDIIMCGKRTYSYLRQVLAGRIRATPDKMPEAFGRNYFQLDDGVFVTWESGIDRLPVEEMYVGDSSTLRIGLDGGEKAANMTLIEDWPEMPDAMLLQGYAEICFVNECPRWWGRAYNVQVP